MRAILSWLQGKKTILGGTLMILAAVAGVWFGKLDAVTGVGLFGAGLSTIGWGDKANRHQAELLAALAAVGAGGQQARAGNSAAVQMSMRAAIGDLAPAIAEAVIEGSEGGK